MKRRAWFSYFARTSLILACGGLPAHSLFAGAQREEDLSDSIRTALTAAVTLGNEPPEPIFVSAEDRLLYKQWVAAMSARLGRKRQPYLLSPEQKMEFLQTVWYESKRAGLDVALVLGLVQVESNFR